MQPDAFTGLRAVMKQAMANIHNDGSLKRVTFIGKSLVILQMNNPAMAGPQ